MFTHFKVRLFCELSRAERWLTEPDMLNRWLKEDADSYEIQMVQRREKVAARWNPAELSAKKCGEHLEFNLMQCATRTLYCSEIHLMVYPQVEGSSNQSPADVDAWRTETKAYWTSRLEALRVCVNGDWVIEDRDLTRSILKGSRI
ncbi:MAG: hypothetical protein Q7I98_01715 [Erysipelotrichaceae bacterium]|nr:hypothetical protein [Erysipelotrichaceae bacterium]